MPIVINEFETTLAEAPSPTEAVASPAPKPPKLDARELEKLVRASADKLTRVRAY